MIRRILLPLLLAALLVCFMSGCSGSFKPKTVIIPDAEAAPQTDESSEDFTVDQIYTLFDSEDLGGEALGWMDKDHVLGTFWHSGDGRSYELMDYEHNVRQQLLTSNGKALDYALSSDGSREAEILSDGGEMLKLRLIHWNGGKPEKADIADIRHTTLISKIEWSNNSRYLAYIKKTDVKAQPPQIVVYDTQLKQWNTFAFPAEKQSAEVSSVKSPGIDSGTYIKVSDDGKSALILEQKLRQPVLLVGSLENHEFAPLYERDASRGAGADFVNNAQIMFVGSKGSLYLYDSRNSTTATLLDGIGMFRLSNDRKYIAYTTDKVDLYAARLQGNSVTNKQSVYKGATALRIEWSPDNGKILLDGRATVAGPLDAAQTAPLPLVLEFKR